MKSLKKYVVFVISFVVLSIGFQLLSGWIVTALYDPVLTIHNKHVHAETAFGQNSMFLLLSTLVVATVAYFLSQQIVGK